MTSKLKVEFIDNASSQYDQNASIIKYNQSGIDGGNNKKKLGRFYLGETVSTVCCDLLKRFDR